MKTKATCFQYVQTNNAASQITWFGGKTVCQTFLTKKAELIQSGTLEGARHFKLYILSLMLLFSFLLNIHTYIH